MKMFKSRVLPALIFTLITIGWMAPIAVFSKEILAARISSYVFAILFTCFVAHEYFSSQRISKIFVAQFMILLSAAIIFPVETNFKIFLSNGLLTPHSIAFYARNLSLDFVSIIICLFAAFYFFVIEYVTRESIAMDRFVRFLLTFFSTYLLIFAVKIIQVSLIVNWRFTIVLLLIPSISDTFGFFGGKFFGHKFFKSSMAPVISPKKTWEGFFASLIGTIAISFGLIYGFDLFENQTVLKVIFCLFAPLLAIFGDLYFSYIKRINGVKDYSRILAGHGGILDRFDSVAFVCILVYILLIFS